MVTKDEALKMAIEAMEKAQHHMQCDMGIDTIDVALQACKEALEQPAQEPVAWIEVKKDAGFKCIEVWQEPVSKNSIPLYTHPCVLTHPAPSWQGLSDGDIQEHLGDELVTLHGWSFVQGVRWANKKLKEKNNAV